jgi:hypothetical protein
VNAAEGVASISGDNSQALFDQQLAAYRRIVAENLMYHREVYGCLHDVLSRLEPGPLKFLDIACGDAVASAEALRDTAVEHYYGVDLSARSLELASEALKVLACPVDLRCEDFADAMADWSPTVDFAWVGMSLHHLQLVGKVQFMRDAHRALSQHGTLMIWEPTLLEDEGRAGWLDRFSACRSAFAAVSDEDFAAMENHTRLADFPESADTWKSIGRQASFANSEELFTMPNRLGRIYRYWK